MNSISKLCIFSLLLTSYGTLFSQWGISVYTPEATDGYTLFQLSEESSFFLIDNCGEVVHQWKTIGGQWTHPKLLPNGNVLYSTNSKIIERSWDNELLNEVELSQSGIPGLSFRYETIKLDNGNYLSVGRKFKSFEEFVELGFDMTIYQPSETDVVVEVDSASGEVVWLWDIGDHIIQERDDTKGNFGIVKDHPELLNTDAILTFDWNEVESFMINGMDYNPELDQIALSVRKLSELIIIDHTTTTEEAQSSEGGKYGKGGDILYRWGNPVNYNQGTEADRYLYFQHNPKWILEGPHKGKLTCFNNGLDRPWYINNIVYSDVPIINTPVISNGDYELIPGDPFLPISPDFIFSGEIDLVDFSNATFWSPYTSGGTVFPNGNVFISEGESSRLLEVNMNGDLVWEYNIPTNNYLFRAEKYGSEYPAFNGKNLNPINFDLPFVNSELECELVSNQNKLLAESDIFSVTSLDMNSFNLQNKRENQISIHLIDLNGSILDTYQIYNHDSKRISVDRFPAGIYFLSATDLIAGQIQSQKIILY